MPTTRRDLLQLAALAAGARPKIERLETFVVKVNHRGNWVLVRVTSSDGVTGIGDASHGAGDAQQIALIRRMFDRVKGRGIFDLEAMRAEVAEEVSTAGRAGAVAWSALEQCLWDIRGKSLGLPVYDLLGGRVRERIRNYANINRTAAERTPTGFAKWAEAAAMAGFDAVKLAPFDGMPRRPKDESEWEKYLTLGLDCAAAVRRALGEKRDLLIDVHSHCDLRHGLDLARRFEPLRLFWLEEVTPAASLSDLAAINREAKMPTAGGESIFGVKNFYRYIAGAAVDILMPDIKYAGGIWETKKVAAMAEAAGLQVAPHGPASPVGNIAAAHLCATLPNFLILEFAFGEVPWRAELIEPAEEIRDGYIVPSPRPGFGVTLNEAALKKYAA